MAKPGADRAVLALVDLSGSMRGQPVASVGVQLQELLWELREIHMPGESRLWFGLMAFHEEIQWLLPPTPVDQVVELPQLQVLPRKDGFYPTTSYEAMLMRLTYYLFAEPHFWPEKPDDLELILFTDGRPTDGKVMLQVLYKLIGETELGSDSCRWHFVQEGASLQRPALAQVFSFSPASTSEDVFSAQDISILISRLRDRLTSL